MVGIVNSMPTIIALSCLYLSMFIIHYLFALCEQLETQVRENIRVAELSFLDNASVFVIGITIITTRNSDIFLKRQRTMTSVSLQGTSSTRWFLVPP